jgi:hypothetical protein
MTRKSTQTVAKTTTTTPPFQAAAPVHHLRTGRPTRPASGPGRQPRPHLRPRTRRLRHHPRRDRGTHRPRRQGLRDGAEREGPANPPATDHRRLRRLRLRGRPVLRHQEVGGDGTHQQAAQRRSRRGPRRSGRVREQGRACPPVRRRDGAAVLRPDGRRRGCDHRLRGPHRREWKPYEAPRHPPPACPASPPPEMAAFEMAA